MKPKPLIIFPLAVLGCGGPNREEGPPAAGARRDIPVQARDRVDATSGGPTIPGPPSTIPPPSSSDPAVRAVEDRLYKTDGGKVVLKAIRAHGGWAAWTAAHEIGATAQAVPPPSPAPGSPAATAPAPVPVPASEGLERISVHVAMPPEMPAAPSARIVAAPFWFASPAARLEYEGVELTPDGETYDKVRVFQEDPGSPWSIAYFNRHTGVLARLLGPASPGTALDREFLLVEVGNQRKFGEMLLATRWVTYRLRNRFARPDPSRPDRVDAVEIAVR